MRTHLTSVQYANHAMRKTLPWEPKSQQLNIFEYMCMYHDRTLDLHYAPGSKMKLLNSHH
jgi:hypothetical protein